MASRTITIDLALIKKPDAATIDRIARLQCEMKRRGHDVQIVNANDELRDLIDLCGLSRVLRVEPRR
jgi:ABC-type transporter Mla MlaB component